jgi:hypothetical protein
MGLSYHINVSALIGVLFNQESNFLPNHRQVQGALVRHQDPTKRASPPSERETAPVGGWSHRTARPFPLFMKIGALKEREPLYKKYLYEIFAGLL